MEFFSRRVPRRAFLAGMAAAMAAAASAVGLLTWRARDRAEEEAAETSAATGGIFGEWVDADGLPAFRYTLDHRSDPRARYAIRDGVDSTLQWHHVGNDATAAIAANDGWVQLFDFSRGPRWMNVWEPERGRYAGGFGYVFEDGEVLPTLFLDADPAAPGERVFGTGYFDTRLLANQLEIDRRVLLPFGGSSWLLSRVTVRNLADHARSIRHFEYWDVNPRWLAFGATDEQRAEAAAVLEYDVSASTARLTATERQTAAAESLRKMHPPRVPPEPGPRLFLVPLADTPVDGFDTDPGRFFGDGTRARPAAVAAGACTRSIDARHPCFVYQSNLELPPHGEATLWFAYGYSYEGLPEFPSDPENEEQRTLDAWRSWLPAFRIKGEPGLCRELTWHAYYLRASSFYDAYFDRRTIPQGFWYLYGSGFNAGLRDSVQHALPLVYFEPDLARDVLLSVLAQADETGHFPYSMTGFGIAWDFIWRPGDHDIWALWLASEYVLATRDTALLDQALAYYPPQSAATAPVWDHLVLAYRHLVDVVGVGAQGLLHARNADWNDGLVFEAAPGDMQGFIRDGESTLASAFAAWVLPRFASVARERGDPAFADEVDAFASALRERLRQFWMGRWLARAILPAGEIYGTDRLHLEPQPWAILAGVTDDTQTDVLLDEIDALLREGSPLGARLFSQGSGDRPSGDSTQGGVWLSITHTLVWGAARRKPELAWDEFVRNTLRNHTAHYPDVWVGAWSGPDAYNSDWSSRPGWTWDLPALNVYGQYWPIQNVHTHSQPLLSFLRLAGVEPMLGGLRIAPAFPFDEWNVASPSFALDYSPDVVAGRMSTRGDRIEFHLRLPAGLVGRELRVTSSAAAVHHELRGADVILRLEGAAAGGWDWRVERA
jgi:hypothetical protein